MGIDIINIQPTKKQAENMKKELSEQGSPKLKIIEMNTLNNGNEELTKKMVKDLYGLNIRRSSLKGMFAIIKGADE